MTATLLPYGEHALLVELDGLDEVLALDAALKAARETGGAPYDELVDVVPAARTVLLVLRPGAGTDSVAKEVTRLQEGLTGTGDDAGPGRDTTEVEIGVHYDGPDLDEVASLTGLSVEEVVAAHTGTPWQAAFAGFAPGFVYLAGGDPRLRVPRRDEPRTAVPAGAVGLAGEFSAVYPQSSPGGWQLLGHTDELMWSVDRERPALVQPGTLVRFFDVGAETR